MTHGHRDHAGNLDSLLTAFPVKSVYISGKDTVSYADIDVRSIVQKHGVELHELWGGEVLSLGGATAEIWIPQQVDTKEANNNSVIMRLVHGNTAYLCTGDAEKEEERLLLSSGVPLQADVLKLGHHGEDNSTSSHLLDAVKPRFGIITGSLAENPDSVNAAVAGRLKNHRVKPYYSEGDLIAVDFNSDGSKVWVTEVPDRSLSQELSLSFHHIDRKAQTVTIQNNASCAANLEGCLIKSEKGNELFFFSAGIVLQAGEQCIVSCLDSPVAGDFVWQEESVWANKKADRALLYDKNLNLLDENYNQR